MFNILATINTWIKTDGAVLEFWITIATTFISFLVFLRTRKLEKKLFGESSYKSIKQENNVAVVFDLIDGAPETQIAQITNSIDTNDTMRDIMQETVVDAPALQNCDSIPEVLDGGFRIGYSLTNEKEKTGRFITVGGRSFPENTESAKMYQRHFAKCMTELCKKLKSGGVSTVHIFFRGPTAAAFYVGECFDNSFRTMMYHYWNGNYFYYPMDAPNKSLEQNKRSDSAENTADDTVTTDNNAIDS